MPEDLEQQLKRFIRNHMRFMNALRAVRSVAPLEACIANGAIRKAVPDAMRSYVTPLFLADVQAPYFNQYDLSNATEQRYEKRLEEL